MTLLTPKEAAQYLRRPLSGIWSLVRTGSLPAIRDGRRDLILKEDLEAYVKARRTTPMDQRRSLHEATGRNSLRPVVTPAETGDDL